MSAAPAFTSCFIHACCGGIAVSTADDAGDNAGAAALEGDAGEQSPSLLLRMSYGAVSLPDDAVCLCIVQRRCGQLLVY
jgi:hypothetical protein